MVGCDNLVNREDKIEGPTESSIYGNDVTTSVSCNRVVGDWLLIVKMLKGVNRAWAISCVMTESRVGAMRDIRYNKRTIRLMDMSLVRAGDDAMVFSTSARM